MWNIYFKLEITTSVENTTGKYKESIITIHTYNRTGKMSLDSVSANRHQLLPSNMAPALTSLTEPTRIRFKKKNPIKPEKYSQEAFSRYPP